jgi:hypothetical protein
MESSRKVRSVSKKGSSFPSSGLARPRDTSGRKGTIQLSPRFAAAAAAPAGVARGARARQQRASPAGRDQPPSAPPRPAPSRPAPPRLASSSPSCRSWWPWTRARRQTPPSSGHWTTSTEKVRCSAGGLTGACRAPMQPISLGPLAAAPSPPHQPGPFPSFVAPPDLHPPPPATPTPRRPLRAHPRDPPRPAAGGIARPGHRGRHRGRRSDQEKSGARPPAGPPTLVKTPPGAFRIPAPAPNPLTTTTTNTNTTGQEEHALAFIHERFEKPLSLKRVSPAARIPPPAAPCLLQAVPLNWIFC